MIAVGGVTGNNSAFRGVRTHAEMPPCRQDSAGTLISLSEPIAFEVVGVRFLSAGGGDGMIGRGKCVLGAFFRRLGWVPEPLSRLD